MQPIVISDILAVGEVPTLEQIEILAKAGFKSIINNQSDGEVERFPVSAEVAREAARVGLGHAYVPIASRTPTPDELLAFARALDTLPSPIYAFCYSGARSAAATAFLLTKDREPASIISEFGAAGYDISPLAPWLEEQRALHAPKAKANGNGKHPAAAAVTGTLPVEAGAAPAAAAPSQRETPPPGAAERALKGIVVHARSRGAGGFAMVGH